MTMMGQKRQNGLNKRGRQPVCVLVWRVWGGSGGGARCEGGGLGVGHPAGQGLRFGGGA